MKSSFAIAGPLLSCAILLGCSQHKSSALSSALQPTPPRAKTWTFVVAGDSRNCGDVIMPAIAEGAHAHNAQFYWHLGDLRKISGIDQDFQQLASLQHQTPTLDQYRSQAWQDFIKNQVQAFDSTPFFIGIGNHETIPPKTRDEFRTQFEYWLNAPEIKIQRLKDDPNDNVVKTYYHWVRDGIDFITLDNATHDEFDPAQVKWFEALLAHDQNGHHHSHRSGWYARSTPRKYLCRSQHERMACGRGDRP